MPVVSTAARWAAATGIVVGVIVVAALVVGNGREPRIWTLPRGSPVTFSADMTGPNDLYRCPGMGAIPSSPSPGRVAPALGGLTIRTEPDGRVIARCVRAAKTWVIPSDGDLFVSADRVTPYDRYACVGTGSVTGTPEPRERVLGPYGISVDTAPDGAVTVVCPVG